jgi:hypothetical protein
MMMMIMMMMMMMVRDARIERVIDFFLHFLRPLVLRDV